MAAVLARQRVRRAAGVRANTKKSTCAPTTAWPRRAFDRESDGVPEVRGPVAHRPQGRRQATNGWFRRTIVRLSTAAKLTQARYGANSSAGRQARQAPAATIGARIESHRNGTSTSAQSGRRSLKNSGLQRTLSTPLARKARRSACRLPRSWRLPPRQQQRTAMPAPRITVQAGPNSQSGGCHEGLLQRVIPGRQLGQAGAGAGDQRTPQSDGCDDIGRHAEATPSRCARSLKKMRTCAIGLARAPAACSCRHPR